MMLVYIIFFASYFLRCSVAEHYGMINDSESLDTIHPYKLKKRALSSSKSWI